MEGNDISQCSPGNHRYVAIGQFFWTNDQRCATVFCDRCTHTKVIVVTPKEQEAKPIKFRGRFSRLLFWFMVAWPSGWSYESFCAYNRI